MPTLRVILGLHLFFKLSCLTKEHFVSYQNTNLQKVANKRHQMCQVLHWSRDTVMGVKKWCQLEQSGTGLVLFRDQFRLNATPFFALPFPTPDIYQENFKSEELKI